MKVTKVHSWYKLFGGFGLLLLFNLVLGFATFQVFEKALEVNSSEWQFWIYEKETRLFLFVFGIQSLFLILFMTQCRYIIIRDDSITFINPVLPFLRKTRKWSYYDDFKSVKEHARGGTYEAIWLLKNKRLKDRISSFYYINFYEIERSIGVKYSGELNANPFKQFFYLLGFRIN